MRFLDLCAGIGGFRLGMELAGHSCAGFCEIDRFAVASYRAIHLAPEGSEYYAEDIWTIDPASLPDADCFCAGFPCQSFSVAGARRGFEDERGTVLFAILRLVQARQPRFLFFENVPGLLSHENGESFRVILDALDGLGYDCEWQVLDSQDFGVPQKRRRVYLIGHHRDRRCGQVFPVAPESAGTVDAKECGNAIQDAFFVTKEDKGFCMRDVATCLDANYYKGLDAHQMRTGVFEIRPVIDLGHTNKRQHGRIVKEHNEAMFTLLVRGVHGLLFLEKREDGLIYGRIRKLTPLECFRLQGFDDEHFNRARASGVSDTQLYKQAGNCVTVPVIEAIAKRLREIEMN